MEATQSYTSENVKSDLSYFNNIAGNSLVYRTIGQELSLVASKISEQEAFVFYEEGKRIKYGQLLREADKLAAGFKCLGLTKGDRIGFLMPNVSTWPIGMFAAARAGLISVHLNPTAKSKDIECYLKNVSAKVLLVSEKIGELDFYEKLVEIIPELLTCSSGVIKSDTLPSLTTIIIDSEKYFTGTCRLRDIMALPTASQVKSIEDYQVHISPDSGCQIIFTSGFTGAPKPVLLSHLGVLNSAYHMNKLDINNGITCMPLPFSHITGSGFLTLECLTNHTTIVIPSAMYDPEKALYAMSEEDCRFISGTPSLYMAMISKQRELNLEISDISALIGVTHCSEKLFYDIKEVLNVKKLFVGLGMTEHSGLAFTTTLNDEDHLMLDGTVGRILSNMEAKVINEAGEIVPFGTPGELCVRGCQTMIGYWENEEKTKSVLGPDGWLRTGDCLIFQPNGCAKILTRMDDIIRKGSEKINVREIEDLLQLCPSIAEAYIVGIPDKQWGQDLYAFVRLHNGIESFSWEDLSNYCEGKVPSFHIPRYVQIVEDFPKTMSGKVKKQELKNQISI